MEITRTGGTGGGEEEIKIKKLKNYKVASGSMIDLV